MMAASAKNQARARHCRTTQAHASIIRSTALQRGTPQHKIDTRSDVEKCRALQREQPCMPLSHKKGTRSNIVSAQRRNGGRPHLLCLAQAGGVEGLVAVHVGQGQHHGGAGGLGNAPGRGFRWVAVWRQCMGAQGRSIEVGQCGCSRFDYMWHAATRAMDRRAWKGFCPGSAAGRGRGVRTAHGLFTVAITAATVPLVRGGAISQYSCNPCQARPRHKLNALQQQRRTMPKQLQNRSDAFPITGMTSSSRSCTRPSTRIRQCASLATSTQRP